MTSGDKRRPQMWNAEEKTDRRRVSRQSTQSEINISFISYHGRSLICSLVGRKRDTYLVGDGVIPDRWRSPKQQTVVSRRCFCLVCFAFPPKVPIKEIKSTARLICCGWTRRMWGYAKRCKCVRIKAPLEARGWRKHALSRKHVDKLSASYKRGTRFY